MENILETSLVPHARSQTYITKSGGKPGNETTWKHACFCAYSLKMKAQKHACFHVHSAALHYFFALSNS